MGTLQNPPIAPKIGMLSGISTPSITTLASILLGFLGTKLIALHWGPSGIASLGNGRNILLLFTLLFSWRAEIGLLSDLSSLRSVPTQYQLKRFILPLFLRQCAFGILGWVVVSLLFSGALLREIQILLMASFCLAGFLYVKAIFKASGELSLLFWIEIASATGGLLTLGLLTAFPFGAVAFYLASAPVFGLCVGIYYLYRRYNPGGPEDEDIPFHHKGPKLFYLALDSATLALGTLTLRYIVQYYFGESGLAGYNAVMLLSETGILCLMSSLESFYFPQLSRLASQEEDSQFTGRFLMTLSAVALLASLVTLVISKEIALFFFSEDLIYCHKFLEIISFSWVPQIFSWVAAIRLIKTGQMKRLFWITAFGYCLIIGAFILCGHYDLSFLTLAVAYVMGCWFFSLIFILKRRKEYFRILSKTGFKFLIGFYFCLLGFYLINYSAP